MAHKKGLGSSRNGRDSNAKRLGVKVFAGQTVTGGEIIVRQRGTRFKPGDGVGIGKDDTIFAKTTGRVRFENHGAHGRVAFFRRGTQNSRLQVSVPCNVGLIVVERNGREHRVHQGPKAQTVRALPLPAGVCHDYLAPAVNFPAAAYPLGRG